MKPLIVRDEVHGDMVFDHLLRNVIDHEAFQRLRHIRQLGLAEYVFPCANHTRFQHSMGASYLAGQYYERMLKTWLTSPFIFHGETEATRFLTSETLHCVEDVADHSDSHHYWWQVISLAGLLHDVGHGPWSHTFEHLELRQNFSKILEPIPGAVGEYLRSLSRLRHEDLSVVYIYKILEDLQKKGVVRDARLYFVPVSTLVNRKLTEPPHKNVLEVELEKLLHDFKIKGGAAFHRLLRPIISGPFDVDRMDYIQRDGRNCGVLIGGIEWRRIVSKLLPCLAERRVHSDRPEEPSDVVLVSHVKNQHVLDDFVFSLFQMYTQVYLHPKVVGLEEIIHRSLEQNVELREKFVVDFSCHQTLTDDRFYRLVTQDYGLQKIGNLLKRQEGSLFEVASFTTPSGLAAELEAEAFKQIKDLDRPMMKDSVGLFLYSSFKTREEEKFFVKPWTEVSPIAHQFYQIKYSPEIWVRSKEQEKTTAGPR